MGNLIMLVRQKRNLEQDLITIKVQTDPIEKKNKKDHYQRFHDHRRQHSQNGIDDWEAGVERKENLFATQA